ncbi:MAG: sulfatase-like hydrolase/transferase [Pseudomonadota bacterium]
MTDNSDSSDSPNSHRPHPTTSSGSSGQQEPPPKQPNILFITVDQMRFPDFSDADGGMVEPLKEIFGFREISEGNPYVDQFPGFMRLRKHATTLNNHHIATSACVPSRTIIYTGQYGTRTHAMETDSLFKFGSDPNFPWLDPRGIPTIGDWFRAAGYDTHYFGKWDLSYADVPGPNKGDINEWGFADWKLSSPDAQGGQLNQLGVYRDGGYADLACDFIKRKAMNYQDTPDEPKPWFATVSIVNPHDIASAYPISWWMPKELKLENGNTIPGRPGVQTIHRDGPLDDPEIPKPVPRAGAKSNALPGGTATIDLNPNGFGRDETLFNNPGSLTEDLKTKPDCQFDYSYKMGLALKSRRPKPIQEWQTLPFQTMGEEKSAEWFQAYGQFYAYLHSLADREIARVLDTLDASGLTDDTIVVFLSDHGEYGGTHGGMIEKWHTAYDQILRVPVVVSSAQINDQEDQMKSVDQLTSHIDILPTLLSFAGYKTTAAQDKLGHYINKYCDQTYFPLPGANLEQTLSHPHHPISFPNEKEDGKRREILFITDDTITNHLKGEAPTLAYEQFLEAVEEAREAEPRLYPGPVVQPNHIRCIKWHVSGINKSVDGSCWKLARYWDPNGERDDQYEFYYSDQDPAEMINLVKWKDSEPILQEDRIPDGWGLSFNTVQEVLHASRKRLQTLEQRYLEPVSPFEEAYTLEPHSRSD